MRVCAHACVCVCAYVCVCAKHLSRARVKLKESFFQFSHIKKLFFLLGFGHKKYVHNKNTKIYFIYTQIHKYNCMFNT